MGEFRELRAFTNACHNSLNGVLVLLQRVSIATQTHLIVLIHHSVILNRVGIIVAWDKLSFEKKKTETAVGQHHL